MCEICARATSRLSRRAMMAGGLALAGAGHARAAVGPDAPNAIAPDAALNRLLEGNRRYARNAPQNQDYSHDRAGRASAQYPIAAVLSCSDSRVAPEVIFDQGPGQLFIVRVAGNFVSIDGLASLEYGVKFLGAPLIVVLGHTGCGAIAAALKVLQQGEILPGHLPELIANLKPAVQTAVDRKPKDLLQEATCENIHMNVARLNHDQPIVAEKVAKGRIRVAGAIYDISTGDVRLL